MVDGDRKLGKEGWVAVGVAGDHAPDADALGGLGHRRLQRPTFVDRSVRATLADRRKVIEVPYVVETGLVRHAPDGAERFDCRALARQLEPEAQWMRRQSAIRILV